MSDKKPQLGTAIDIGTMNLVSARRTNSAPASAESK